MDDRYIDGKYHESVKAYEGKEKRFAVFILSHGRANDLKTAVMLEKYNYHGDWYVVIDDEDSQEPIYRQKFGRRVLQFNKKEIADRTDTGDMDTDRRVGVFARNKIQEFAHELGYKYHLQLDDDFTAISYRYQEGQRVRHMNCTNLDKLFSVLCDYMDTAPVTWLSLSLSSYYLGGVKSKNWEKKLIPKTMGSFLMRRDHPVWFRMRMNDDITTTILNWHRGNICFSVLDLQVQTPETQSAKGGMTDIYQDNGTYRKSFYSVLCCPSFVKVGKQGITNYRIHHEIEWNNCTPKILNQRWKKT